MSSQITFALGGPFNVVKPLQYIAQADINAIPTASPSFTAAAINSEIRPKIDHMTVDVRRLGEYGIYKQIAVGHDYGFGFSLNPYNLPLLKYGSEEPNIGTPAGTSAEYLGFILSYYQAAGAALSEHYLKIIGAKCNTLELSVTPTGLVEANMEWICREIALPTTTHGLTTPTFITNSGITSSPLAHVDNGASPLTLDGTAYPCTSFRINYNNNLIVTRCNGSDLVDSIDVGNREITGSFTIPVGKNLTLETNIRTAEQTPITASYVFKTGTMVATMAELETLSYSPVMGANSNNINAWEYSFKCKTAALSA